MLQEGLFFVEMIVKFLADNSSHKHLVVVLFLRNFQRSFHFGALLSWQAVTFDGGGSFVGFDRFWLVFGRFFFNFDFDLRKVMMRRGIGNKGTYIRSGKFRSSFYLVLFLPVKAKSANRREKIATLVVSHVGAI